MSYTWGEQAENFVIGGYFGELGYQSDVTKSQNFAVSIVEKQGLQGYLELVRLLM